MVVQVPMLVGNVSELLASGFTHLEVHRSRDAGNTWEEVTAASPMPAVLYTAEARTLYRIGGSLLRLQVDGGVLYDVEFSPLVQDWSPAQVAARIEEVAPGIATALGQRVKLSSPTTGRASSVRVAYCDAFQLGLIANQEERGRAGRIALVEGMAVYTFIDVAGSAMDRYRWRFSKNGLSPVSDFSAAAYGDALPLLNAEQLSVAVARFSGIDGRPRKMRILIGTPEAPVGAAGSFVGEDAPVVVDSDSNGFLQFTLVRGLKVRVAIEGTLYVREFVVPNAPTFDLLTVMASAPDPFTVQTPPPLLTRRSL